MFVRALFGKLLKKRSKFDHTKIYPKDQNSLYPDLSAHGLGFSRSPFNLFKTYFFVCVYWGINSAVRGRQRRQKSKHVISILKNCAKTGLEKINIEH